MVSESWFACTVVKRFVEPGKSFLGRKRKWGAIKGGRS